MYPRTQTHTPANSAFARLLVLKNAHTEKSSTRRTRVKNRGIEKYRDSPYGIDLQRIAKGWNILDSRRRGIFIRHCDHDLYRGMPFEGKHSVLDPLFIVIRVRIAHLLDQLAVHIQIICRKYLRQIQAISMLF